MINPDHPFSNAFIARLSPNRAHLVDAFPSTTMTSPSTFSSTNFLTYELSSIAVTVLIIPQNFLFFPYDLKIGSPICILLFSSQISAVLNKII